MREMSLLLLYHGEAHCFSRDIRLFISPKLPVPLLALHAGFQGGASNDFS